MIEVQLIYNLTTVYIKRDGISILYFKLDEIPPATGT